MDVWCIPHQDVVVLLLYHMRVIVYHAIAQCFFCMFQDI